MSASPVTMHDLAPDDWERIKRFEAGYTPSPETVERMNAYNAQVVSAFAPDFFHRQLDRFDTALKPDWTVTIKQLYKCGRTIPEIVKALYDAPGVNLGAVMDALGIDYFCEVCGRGVDLNDGETCWDADGDRDYPFWGVAPHGSFGFECDGGGAFVSRGNIPYPGENPMRERAE